jgi:hypothetical protein
MEISSVNFIFLYIYYTQPGEVAKNATTTVQEDLD